MNIRELEILLFDAFSASLKRLCADDYLLFSTQKKKGPITHRIAMYLEQELANPAMLCDTQFQIRSEKECFTPDIVVHNRMGEEYMALFWQDGYLIAHERENARDFHKEKRCFTLAFSLLPDKDYFLIYRFAENYTDYLHISRDDFSETVLKRCGVDEDIFDDQLRFKLVRRRGKKASAAEDAPLSE